MVVVLTRIRQFLTGSFVLLAVAVSSILASCVIFVFAVVKLLTPKGPARNKVTHLLSAIGETWISFNQFLSWVLYDIKWDIQLPDELNCESRYLVFCNHQSWVDILVLQHTLNRRAPFMRFLLKQELIWVPFLGFCWWAMDMAFLRRYTRAQLIRNPELRGKDLENAARACEKLKHIPVSMMAFPEGTRFTVAKRDQQKSPYAHLLRPRYGGVGQILYSFDDAFDYLVDVTIQYQGKTPELWQFVTGQVKHISVKVRLLPIPEEIRGKNFREDSLAKNALKTWLADLWAEKEQTISSSSEITQADE